MTTIHRHRPSGISPAHAGQTRQRLLTHGAALTGLAAAFMLVAACASSGGTAAGQAHGNNYSDSFNGIKFTWQIVTPSGKPAGAGSPAPTPSYSTQSGY